MTTKPPSEVNYVGDDNFTKKIYSAIDELKEIIPIDNDRYRLSFCLSMYFNNEITDMMDAVDQADPRSSTLDYPELFKRIVQIFNEHSIKKEQV